MLFSSFTFILLFLPAFFLLYFVSPQSIRSHVIVLFSCLFYAWWRIDFLALILGISGVTYIVGLSIERTSSPTTRWTLLVLGIAANLATLIYFKYAGLVANTSNLAFQNLGLHWTIPPLTPLLPIGISFHIFQSVSFLVDVYRREAVLAKRVVDFAAFSLLFPQLIAGPVVKYREIAPQIAAPDITTENFLRGAQAFAIGLSKKVLIADNIAPIVDFCFAQSNPTFLESWLGAVAYSMQLYFDFSGYTDMASGVALAMGIKFPRNFDNPYLSSSITEFWRRWHISLSTWLREYLYIPLGGNRGGRLRTYGNLMTTMVLGGLWHGANWTFAVWGGWHGILLAVERLSGRRSEGSMPTRLFAKSVRVATTFLLVALGWLVFRASTLEEAVSMLVGTTGVNGFGFSDFGWTAVPHISWTALSWSLVVAFIATPIAKLNPSLELMKVVGLRFGAAPLFIISVFRLVSETTRPFLYFQF